MEIFKFNNQIKTTTNKNILIYNFSIKPKANKNKYLKNGILIP